MYVFSSKTILIASLFLCAVAYEAVGQEAKSGKATFGIGVSLFELSEYFYEHDNVIRNAIFLPVDFGDKIRIRSIRIS